MTLGTVLLVVSILALATSHVEPEVVLLGEAGQLLPEPASAGEMWLDATGDRDMHWLEADEDSSIAWALAAEGTYLPEMTEDEMLGIEAIADAPLRLVPITSIHSASGASPPSVQATSAVPAELPAGVPAESSPLSVPVGQAPQGEIAPSDIAAPEPTLDIATLTTRLRNTSAIGTFTKLTLKNQMDDLVEQFRQHHLGGTGVSAVSLRQPYDMLFLKVLTLVQDGDPGLARTISGSREAIWGMLADRNTFNTVT